MSAELETSELRDAVRSETLRIRDELDNVAPTKPLLDEETPPTNEYQRYVYPTLIVLPVVILVILVLASSAQMIVKVLVFALAIVSIITFYMKSEGITQLKYIMGPPKVPVVSPAQTN